MSTPTTLEALQETLAAEHAAIWVYGVLGGQTARGADQSLRRRVEAAYEVHGGRRDELSEMVRRLGVEPVPSAVGYRLPGRPGDPAGQAALAARVEERAAAVYADLVAASVGPQRAWAIGALTDAALRALGFGGRPSAFPGLRELAEERAPRVPAPTAAEEQR